MELAFCVRVGRGHGVKQHWKTVRQNLVEAKYECYIHRNLCWDGDSRNTHTYTQEPHTRMYMASKSGNSPTIHLKIWKLSSCSSTEEWKDLSIFIDLLYNGEEEMNLLLQKHELISHIKCGTCNSTVLYDSICKHTLETVWIEFHTTVTNFQM